MTTTSLSTRRSSTRDVTGASGSGRSLRRWKRPHAQRSPRATARASKRTRGLHQILDPTKKYKFIGEQPFEVTNWDPALTQKVLSAAIAKNSKIDVIVSDFGPSLVGALPEFTEWSTDPGAYLGRKRPRMLLEEAVQEESDVQALYGLDSE